MGIRALVLISVCATGFLLGGVWVAAGAAAIAPLVVGAVRIAREP